MLLQPERYRGRIVTPTDIAEYSIHGWTDEQVRAYAIALIKETYRNAEWGREEYESDRKAYFEWIESVDDSLPKPSDHRLTFS